MVQKYKILVETLHPHYFYILFYKRQPTTKSDCHSKGEITV